MPKSPQQLDADLLKFELEPMQCGRCRDRSHSILWIDDEIGLLVIPEIPGWQFCGDTRWKRLQ